MSKKNIILSILAIVILIVLITFASTYQYQDSHLRIEGVRVKLEDGALIVDACDNAKSNLAYCEKTIDLNGKTVKLVFEFKNFKKNGYPSSIVASINGKKIFQKDNLNIEEKGSSEYQEFLNFSTIDDYIFFTYTSGSINRSSTLYGIDEKGNVVLEETEIDSDDMRLKDYTEFINYTGNSIKVYATRIVDGNNYKGKNICDAKASDVVEAYYTYTIKNGKISKKQTETITAKEFIKTNKITCANKN